MLKVQGKPEKVLPDVSPQKANDKIGTSFSDILTKENGLVVSKVSLGTNYQPKVLAPDVGKPEPKCDVSSKNDDSNSNITQSTENNVSSKDKISEKTSEKSDQKATSGNNTSDVDNSFKEVKSDKEEAKVDETNTSVVMSLVGNLTKEISKEIGVTQEIVKDYIDKNTLKSENLLDINSWKSLVTEANGLEDIPAILTNESAFENLKNISNVLDKVDIEDMKQLASRLTEGATDKLVNLSEEGSEIPNIAQEDNLDKVLEKDIEDTTESIVSGKSLNEATIKELPASGFEEETNFTGNENKDKGIKVETKFENSGINNRIFENIVTSITELENTKSISKELVSDIIRQVTIQISNLHAPDRTSLEFMLSPESLGKVTVSVSSKNGILQAELKVTTPEAKAVLESQIADLKLNFENQGLKVENVSIMLSEAGIGNENKNQNPNEEGKKKASKRNSRIEVDDELEEVDTVSMEGTPTVDGTGNNINFSA